VIFGRFSLLDGVQPTCRSRAQTAAPTNWSGKKADRGRLAAAEPMAFAMDECWPRSW
jgi:hypothetical protein